VGRPTVVSFPSVPTKTLSSLPTKPLPAEDGYLLFLGIFGRGCTQQCRHEYVRGVGPRGWTAVWELWYTRHVAGFNKGRFVTLFLVRVVPDVAHRLNGLQTRGVPRLRARENPRIPCLSGGGGDGPAGRPRRGG